MMMSMFSMFDPTSIFSIQIMWMNMIMILIILPPSLWNMNSRLMLMYNLTTKSLHKEFSSLFSNMYMYKGSTLICISLFLLIIMNNLVSNFPYTFCCSAHLSFSLAMSLPIWMTIMMFYWSTLTKTMFAHLVPSGTPSILMPLMVMIEITSNLIRPMALAVRLTANLIAGHLLMALLGNTFSLNNFMWPAILMVETGFMMFELMVAMIQAYVFAVLMTLYSSEIS